MYIVTGGAGFIGSCLVSKLNAEGIYDILIVDNLGHEQKWKNLIGKRYTDYIHKKDFAEMVRADNLPKGVKAVLHMGACSSTVERNADYMLENNYHYTRSLCEWALRHQARFIYASSAATYGEGKLGYSDSDDLLRGYIPMNVYGYSKHLFDLWALDNKLLNQICGLKFFNVYGPNEYHKGFMTSFIYKAFHQIREQGKVNLFKSYHPDWADGESVRDFVYVKDCVEVIWWLLKNPGVNGIYNIGTGRARSWKDLVKATFAATGKKENIGYIEMPLELRGQYQYFTEATMTKLLAAGSPVRFRTIEEGIKDYVQDYLSKEHPYL